MPKPTRNFWIEAKIDTPSGAKQILAGGPAAKDGGFSLTIAMLDGAEIKIYGDVFPDGDPFLQIVGPKGSILKTYVKSRAKIERAAEKEAAT